MADALHEALEFAHRDEESFDVRARCTDPECGWQGYAEVYEGAFAYPCERCDGEDILERLR